MECKGMKKRVTYCNDFHGRPQSAAAVASTVAIAVEVVLSSSDGNLASVIHQFIANKRCTAAVRNYRRCVVAHWAAVARVAWAVSDETICDGAEEIVMQPPVVRSPHRAAVVHVHVPVAVGL